MATSLSRMMKKAANSVIPLANITPHHRNHTYAFRTTSVPTRHQFPARAEKKSISDETLLRVLGSQLDCSEERIHVFAEVPRDFPFKIVDNAMEESIILTREYQGEDIKVKVHGPHHSNEEEEEEDQDEQESDQDEDQQYVYLNVSVSKKGGLTLEFNIAAYADQFTIDGSLVIKNPNASHDYPRLEEPNFLDLDEKLQKAFHTFVEVRGFEPSIGEFLCDYMVQRKHKKYATWLNYLMDFVAISTRNNTKIPTDHHNISALANKISNSDDTLLSVIESQIVYAEEKFHEVLPEGPREFPFKIEDINVGERRSITLTREYQSEQIKVKVYDESYNPPENSYSLIGTVSNQSGLNLKFEVMADSSLGIIIKSLDVKNPNASDKDKLYEWIRFSSLDENFQKAFRTYLEVRGIEPGITNIISDSMAKRKNKINTAWLKHFKNFIAN